MLLGNMEINVMGLLEPHSGIRVDEVVKQLGFTNWLRVEASRYADDIWVLWKNWETSYEYLFSNTQLLHYKIVEKKSNENVLVTFVYGDTSVAKRRELWLALQSIARSVRIAWLILELFVAFLSQSDKVGEVAPLLSLMSPFQDCMNQCNLLELVPIARDRFSWERMGIKERLDWVFCIFEREISHPQTKVSHHLRFKSDHRVIVVSNSSSSTRVKGRSIFNTKQLGALKMTFRACQIILEW
ncbi:hypothetical protein K1719_003268 [Acacia pycnantha]|nr:hypothetical protein K1719_003268 [Acacia pycnantha]